MIRVILAFIFVTILFAVMIHFWNLLNGKGKFKLIKLLGYATILSVLSLSVLTAFVILF
jgi:hypothetical protein